MTITRRQALRSALFGSGYLGLRSLATGLPIAFLENPLRADTCGLDPTKTQSVIMSTSYSGDPLNANVPLTYDFSDIAHPVGDPNYAMASATLGGTAYNMAKVWADLINSADPTIGVGGRINFIHHSTNNNAHPNQPKVQRLDGVLANPRNEMLPSYLAEKLYPCLNTVQAEPIVLGAVSPSEYLTYQGRTLPALSPLALKQTLLNYPGPISNLQALRDQDLNNLNALFKANGNTAQQAYLDQLATSQQQVRGISQNLLNMLNSIVDNGPTGQILAATAMLAMKVSSVISIRLPFGGDNHVDNNLAGEAAQTTASVGLLDTKGNPSTTGIPYLMKQLTALGLKDQVLFFAMNVFGRTLKKKGTTGRDHWGTHHVTVMIGKTVKPGVTGGMVLSNGEYIATPIDSATGASSMGGDIAVVDSLTAVGKTIAAAAGVPQATIDNDIQGSLTITGALA